MRHFRADWNRWTPAERFVAVTGLAVSLLMPIASLFA
jgi:hypothetical protein